MSRLNFKVFRIVRLWLKVWIYSVLFLGVAFCFFPEIKLDEKQILKNLMPLSSNRYWFFTEYVILFFAMPILNAAIRALEKRLLCIVLFAGFIGLSLQPFFSRVDTFHANYGYSAIWFAYLYFVAGCMAVRGFFLEFLSTWKAWLLVLVCGVSTPIVYCGLQGAFPVVRTFSFGAYNSPLMFLYAIGMLVVSSRMHLTSGLWLKLISIIAPSVFSVYILHSNGIFRTITKWNHNWTTLLSENSLPACIGISLASALGIFSICIMVDWFRSKITDWLFRVIRAVAKGGLR